jgi:sulfide dehydrogenase cytochrome subunit
MSKSALLVALAAAALLLGTAPVPAADSPPQVQSCAACHGVEAPSPFPAVPTIHGLPQLVLENALYDFRATIRPCRKPGCGAADGCPELDFCSIVAELSDEDIAILADWYASRDYVPLEQDYHAALAAVGAQLHAQGCESCHGNGGSSPQDQASILRGQPKEYLRNAIGDFRQERRIAVAEMHAMLQAMTPEEVAALVEFYASPLD